MATRDGHGAAAGGVGAGADDAASGSGFGSSFVGLGLLGAAHRRRFVHSDAVYARGAGPAAAAVADRVGRVAYGAGVAAAARTEGSGVQTAPARRSGAGADALCHRRHQYVAKSSAMRVQVT